MRTSYSDFGSSYLVSAGAMDHAALQAQFLQMAACMNADATNHILRQNFLPGRSAFLLPALADLVSPPLASPPTPLVTQGPLPALTEAAATYTNIPDPFPLEEPVPPEATHTVPPSLKAFVAPPHPV